MVYKHEEKLNLNDVEVANLVKDLFLLDQEFTDFIDYVADPIYLLFTSTSKTTTTKPKTVDCVKNPFTVDAKGYKVLRKECGG